MNKYYIWALACGVIAAVLVTIASPPRWVKYIIDQIDRWMSSLSSGGQAVMLFAIIFAIMAIAFLGVAVGESVFGFMSSLHK